MLATAQAASASPSHPQVVVFGTPLVPYVTAIVGNGGTVRGLMQAGQDMHQFAIAPSQMETLERADLLIVPDAGSDPVIARLVKLRPKLKVIELSLLDGAEPLAYRSVNPWVEAIKPPPEPAELKQDPSFKRLPGYSPAAPEPQPDPEAHLRIDPHFWLDPERMAQIALPLATEFSRFSPEHRAVYMANAKAMSTHLRRDVMPALRKILMARKTTVIRREKPEVAFITAHPSYQYFLERFRLPQHGHILSQPESYLGAATLDRIYLAARGTYIRCVISDAKTTLVGRVAELSGAKVVIARPEQGASSNDTPPLEWIQNDYDRVLYNVASAIEPCL